MLRSCVALVLFIFCIEIYVSSVNVPFKDCGSKSLTVEELDFGCEGGQREPCVFIEGKTYSGNISFTTTAGVANGTLVLHAIFENVTLPYPCPNPNVCSHHNLTCPIESGTKAVMTITLEVPSVPIVADFIAEIEIQPLNKSSTADDDIMCAKFLAEIRASDENNRLNF
jgi:hypothetical protein